MFAYTVKIDARTEKNFVGLSDFGNERDEAYFDLVEATEEAEVYEVFSPVKIDRWLDTRPGVLSYERTSDETA